MNDNKNWSILQGDSLQVLKSFECNTFDAIICNPPYASGGCTQAEKVKSAMRKYSSMGDNAPPPLTETQKTKGRGRIGPRNGCPNAVASQSPARRWPYLLTRGSCLR